MIPLPAYAPELNPQEHLWDELREKEFPNRVFGSMQAVLAQLESGLPALCRDSARLRSITAWPWILAITSKANLNKSQPPLGHADERSAAEFV